MDIFKNYQFIVDSYYNIPYQYMSIIDIFKHVIEHNTWNIIHTLQHQQSSSSRMTSL